MSFPGYGLGLTLRGVRRGVLQATCGRMHAHPTILSCGENAPLRTVAERRNVRHSEHEA